MTMGLTHNVQYIPKVLCPRCLARLHVVQDEYAEDYLQCSNPSCRNGTKYRIPTINLEIIQNDEP